MQCGNCAESEKVGGREIGQPASDVKLLPARGKPEAGEKRKATKKKRKTQRAFFSEGREQKERAQRRCVGLLKY